MYANSQNLASFPCWTVFFWTAEPLSASYLSLPLQYVEELAKWRVHQIDPVRLMEFLYYESFSVGFWVLTQLVFQGLALVINISTSSLL